ncbi:MAG: hypothetical protein JWP15_851 [Alphaproteobacteria bacterium]|nr:hypothetical protein [Alphaproteobacteria bacterium]
MKSTSSSAHGIDGAIDFGVAALAAVSIGFVTFAMPEDLFSSLVRATHLPDVLAAAAPPLGAKARFAVMGADALLVFALVWALMRGLGAKAAAKPAAKAADPGAPRVRRADAHPDAPARRPLLAGADLGEPNMDIYDLDTPEPAVAYTHEPQPSVEPARYEAQSPRFESAEDSEDDQALARETAPARLPRFLTTEDPDPEPARDPVVPPSQKKSVDSLTARLPEGPEPRNGDTIGTLMQRLERGLSEREEPIMEPQPEPQLPEALKSASENPEASLSSEGVRHRLRSAISDLNQVANRG